VRTAAQDRRVISFSGADLTGLLGQTYPDQTIEAILEPLGFELTREDGRYRAAVPSWRKDVEGRADIAEEVARVAGYDAIPETMPSGRIPRTPENATLRWEEAARSALAAAGLQEVMTYSLVDPQATLRLDAAVPDPMTGADESMLPVSNPMSVDRSRLRTTLLPSMIETVAANLRYTDRAAVFEIARVYLGPLAPLPREERRVAIAMAPASTSTTSRQASKRSLPPCISAHRR
jgi:phenylalanyl-tRNA synthetase beta chain